MSDSFSVFGLYVLYHDVNFTSYFSIIFLPCSGHNPENNVSLMKVVKKQMVTLDAKLQRITWNNTEQNS